MRACGDGLRSRKGRGVPRGMDAAVAGRCTAGAAWDLRQPQHRPAHAARSWNAATSHPAMAAQSRSRVPPEGPAGLRIVSGAAAGLDRALHRRETDAAALPALPDSHLDDRRQPGREFEYVRHGTCTLLAALEVGSGRVFGHVVRRRTADALVTF